MLVDSNGMQKQKEKLLKTFRKLDKDNNGTLSKEELIKGYAQIMTEEEAKIEVDKVFAMVDFDGCGEIDYNGIIN
jgi:calcium-dependent protein kinase